MIELWEEMECYLSFSDEDMFKGIAPPEETSIIPPEEVTPQSVQPMPAGDPAKEAAVDTPVELAAEKRPPNKFPGLEKVLRLSRPVVAAGEIPPLPRGPKRRPHNWSMGEGLVQIPRTEEQCALTTQSESPSPSKEWEIASQATQPPGFAGVMACLQRNQLPEGASDPDILSMSVLTGPTIATMSTSQGVKDEVMGVTYMDTVTTLVGRVILSGPKQEASTQGPTIQDVTDLI